MNLLSGSGLLVFAGEKDVGKVELHARRYATALPVGDSLRPSNLLEVQELGESRWAAKPLDQVFVVVNAHDYLGINVANIIKPYVYMEVKRYV